MLEELQVPFDHEFVKARPGSAMALQHHPLGKVPSLIVHDGSPTKSWTVYESTVINTYLADTYGHGKFIPPPGTRARVQYDQTVAFLLSEVDSQALWIHRKHDSLRSVFGEASDAVLVEAKRQYHAANRVLLQQLSPYLLGNDFTAADILYVHCLDWAESIGWHVDYGDDDNRKRRAYLEKCRTREGYRRAIARRLQEDKLKEEYRKRKASSL